MRLFKNYGILDYLSVCYDALHTTGRQYIVEDIEMFINARRNSF